MAYLWLKAVHVIAVIAWMAAILYLPRLLVYHVPTKVGSPESETFKVMERRLLRAIMTPAMIVVWITGLWLAFSSGYIQTAAWLHTKILLVLIMSGVHGFLSMEVKRFARDERRRSETFFRVLNEVPTVLMIGIVILVVVKPF